MSYPAVACICIWRWFPREKWKENKIPQPNLSAVSQSCTEEPSQLFLIGSFANEKNHPWSQVTNPTSYQVAGLGRGRKGHLEEEKGWGVASSSRPMCTQSTSHALPPPGMVWLSQDTSICGWLSPEWWLPGCARHPLDSAQRKCSPLFQPSVQWPGEVVGSLEWCTFMGLLSSGCFWHCSPLAHPVSLASFFRELCHWHPAEV